MTSLATSWQQSPGSPLGTCQPDGQGAQFGGGGAVHPDGGGQLQVPPSTSSGQAQTGMAGHAVASTEMTHAVSVLPEATATGQHAAPD